MKWSRFKTIILSGSLILVTTVLLCNLDAQNAPHSKADLPPEIHECDANCNTLTLENGNYTVPPQKWENPSQPIVWVVESYTSQSFTLHRKFPVDQIFTGQISPNGNSLINISVNGKSAPDIKIAWGSALNTVFGSNEERDKSRAGVKTGAAISCDDKGSTPLTSEQFFEAGIRFVHIMRNESAAFACFLKAARLGNASAQVTVGDAYERGISVLVNSSEAMHWYLEAAKQGNTGAQFSVSDFYANGKAVSVNKLEADRWAAEMRRLRNQHLQICTSLRIRDAMSEVELESVHDGVGAVISILSPIDMDMKDARPELVSANGSDIFQRIGKFNVDMGRQSGDFQCKAIFLHGHRKSCGDENTMHSSIKACTEDKAGVDTKLTEVLVKSILNKYPSFSEVYRIRSLSGSEYQVTLVPTSLDLMKTYSTTTDAK